MTHRQDGHPGPLGTGLERARGRVRDAGGAELVERLEHLDRVRPEPPDLPPAPEAHTRPDFDVIIAGGGLSLLLAPLLSDAGLSVAVVDRGTIGVGHREWNASGPELEALVTSGLFTPEELDALIVARYRYGFCHWHGGSPWPVRGVLDHAVDAGRLLTDVRERAKRRGVTLLDRHSVVGDRAGPTAIAVRLRPRDESGTRDLLARVLVDARGASSPDAGWDLVCPTVGGVFTGLAQGEGPGRIDPTVGEILVSTEDVEEGRQHVWEAFPGRPGETTVYLFHYARKEDVRPGELLRLYGRLFERLPEYKAGEARLIRPTFGFIPGWSRLLRRPPPRPRVVRFGDAAAQHSSLTYCGFGHMLRAVAPSAEQLVRVLDADDLDAGRAALLPDLDIHRGTGALSALMSSPPEGAALNRLLDAAFGTLYEMGDEAYAGLLQDRMSPEAFMTFLRRTARRHPKVYAEVFGSLGIASTLRWGMGVVGRARAARRRSSRECTAAGHAEAESTS